jgi:hypothetical protein
MLEGVARHPMTVEETMKKMLKTPPVNPAKRKKQKRQKPVTD